MGRAVPRRGSARPPRALDAAAMDDVWSALGRAKNFHEVMSSLGWEHANPAFAPDDPSSKGGRFVYTRSGARFVVKIQPPSPLPYGPQSLNEWRRWRRLRGAPPSENLAAIYRFGKRRGNWVTFMERVEVDDDQGLHSCPLVEQMKEVLGTSEAPQFGRTPAGEWKAFDYGY